MGFDTIAAFAVLKLKERSPYLLLISSFSSFPPTRGGGQEGEEKYMNINKQAAERVLNFSGGPEGLYA